MYSICGSLYQNGCPESTIVFGLYANAAKGFTTERLCTKRLWERSLTAIWDCQLCAIAADARHRRRRRLPQVGFCAKPHGDTEIAEKTNDHVGPWCGGEKLIGGLLLQVHGQLE
jgi:hypothetical protein